MNVQRMEFLENRSNGSRDTAEELAFSARTLRFRAIRKQTYTGCSKCVESSSCGVSGESAQLKPRYTRKCILFPKQWVLDYRAIATKLTRLVTHAWKVHNMGSGKSLQRKCRDILQVQSYTWKVLLNLTNRNQTNIVFRACVDSTRCSF
jgi:hypothetical protein